MLHPINIKKARETVEGDNRLLKELVALFVKQIPEQLKELNEVIDKSDSTGATNKAHEIKGMVSVFGAEKAYQLVTEIEQCCEEKRVKEAEKIYNLLDKELNNVKSFLLSNKTSLYTLFH